MNSAILYLSIMALTCEKMIDLEFVTFENNGKCFNDYKTAYFYGQNSVGSKKVYYIFTPTWTRCRNVSELEHVYHSYFKSRTGCDHFDIHSGLGITQLTLLEN